MQQKTCTIRIRPTTRGGQPAPKFSNSCSVVMYNMSQPFCSLQNISWLRPWYRYPWHEYITVTILAFSGFSYCRFYLAWYVYL